MHSVNVCVNLPKRLTTMMNARQRICEDMEQAVAKSTFIVPYRIVWGWQGVRRVSERVQLLANNPPQQLSRGFSDDSEDVPDTVSTARLGLSSPTRFFVRFTWFMTGGAPLPAIIFCACSPASNEV